MIQFLVYFLISAFVLFLLYIETKRLKLSKEFKHIPGVKEVAFIGSKYSLTPNKIQDYRLIFGTLCFAPITKFFFASKLIFLASEPNMLQKVLSSPAFTERPFIFHFFRLKYGLISAKQKEWKPIRKAINPAFSQRMSVSFMPVFQKYFKQFNNDIDKYIGKGEFDINHLSIDVGIKLILETNFLQTNFNDKRLDAQLFEDYEDNVSQRIFTAYWHPDFTYKFSQLCKDDVKIEQQMRGIFQRLVDKRREDQNKELANGIVENKPYFINELLKHLKEGHYHDDKMAVENGITVFMAGYETSAMTISYVLLLLAMHPEVDAKVEQEIFENYQPGDEIDFELLKRFTYLDMVIKETLRLFPVAPMTIRESVEDVYIDNVGLLQKGTIVLCNFYNLHRWSHIWGPDADKFKPENFSPENTASRHPYSFLPFSAGPRMCVGYQYAQINVKLGLLMILSRYKFTTKLKMDDFQYKFSITLKLLNGHMVEAHHRTWNNNNE